MTNAVKGLQQHSQVPLRHRAARTLGSRFMRQSRKATEIAMQVA